MVKLRFRLGLYSHREAVSTPHVALENGSDLHVNERQKIRHYRDRSTEDKNKNKNRIRIRIRIRNRNGDFFNFARRAPKLRYNGDVIHSFYRKSAVEHDGGV